MKPLLCLTALFVALSSVTAYAHPGGLNAAGCHNNRKTGGYHCHRGGVGNLPLPSPAPRPLTSPPPAPVPLYRPEAPATEQWLLVVFVFTLDGEDVAPAQLVHKAYRSIEACNAGGRAFRAIVDVPEGAKSLSACVPSEWYSRSGWEKEDLG